MCRLDPARRGHRHRRRHLWLMRSTASVAPRTRRVSESPSFAARSSSLFPIEQPDEHDLFQLWKHAISRRCYLPHRLLVSPCETHDRRRVLRLFLFLLSVFPFPLSSLSLSLFVLAKSDVELDRGTITVARSRHDERWRCGGPTAARAAAALDRVPGEARARSPALPRSRRVAAAARGRPAEDPPQRALARRHRGGLGAPLPLVRPEGAASGPRAALLPELPDAHGRHRQAREAHPWPAALAEGAAAQDALPRPAPHVRDGAAAP